jgi:DNA-binding NarL/FixJ family response regulator
LLRGLIELRREDDAALERFASLGNREREVLVELVAGLDHHTIATKLHLSPHTVRTHTQNILTKLGVHSRLEAARFVFEHDLFSRFGIGDG